MTISGVAYHTGHSKAIEPDPVAAETLERRKWIKRQDRAFIAQLRAAILSGLETPAGVLGQEYGPRLLPTSVQRPRLQLKVFDERLLPHDRDDRVHAPSWKRRTGR
jgi:hypothetical protein